MKYIIVAYDHNRVIGAHNTMPWIGTMASDMARFRRLTAGSTVIMGRKTFDSIGHPLPNRQNIVVTRQELSLEGVTVVHSLSEAYAAAEPDKDIYICGGGEIYQVALDGVDRVLATEIDTSVEGDAFFPPLGPEWHEAAREHHQADEGNKYNYDFVIYVRGTDI